MSRQLPEELLVMIVDNFRLPSARCVGEKRGPSFASSQLASHDRTLVDRLTTLARLSRTSKALLRIARPVLYEIFPGSLLANARGFVKSLIQVPGCAESVKGIVIDDCQDRAGNGTGAQSSGLAGSSFSALESQCLQFISSLRRRTCYPTGTGSAVGAELEYGRADVVLLLLLLLCQNIEDLQILPPCDTYPPFSLDTLVLYRWTANAHKRFQQIRNISIRLPTNAGGAGAAFARGMLRMDNIVEFSAKHLDIGKVLATADFRHAEMPWPGLRKIELRECRLDNVMVGVLLLRAPQLEELDLQWAVQDYPIQFSYIAASLNTFGSNLKTVRLDTRPNFTHLRDANGDSIVAEGHDEPLGDLRGMKNMVSLAVTPRAVLGRGASYDASQNITSLLPTSLRTLTFLGPTREGLSTELTALMCEPLHCLTQEHNNPLELLRTINLQYLARDLADSDFGDWNSTVAQVKFGDSPCWNVALTKL